MAAVLSNTGFDFSSSSSQSLHSRSVSMSSTSSPRSRPQSSHGPPQLGLRPSADEYFAHSTSFTNPEHARNNSDASHSSAYSLGSDLITPADSPPNHNLANPALGKTLLRPTHIRARAAASPYPRDAESVHSSSSETEDISMFLSHSAQDQYHSAQGFVNPHHHQPPPGSHHLSHHQHQHLAQQTMHVPGAFGSLPGPGAGGPGRMGMGATTDHTLEKLAANVRAATTTSASDRAKQIFVQAWLTSNYAPYPDGNVPRQGLYFSYRRVCDQYGIPHINTATLGKAIRLCFPTIKTRRLGVRGNSKYHYCGIRPATSAEAEFLQDYIRKTNNQAAQRSVDAARLATEQSDGATKGEDGSGEDDEDESEGSQSGPSSKRNSLNLSAANKGPMFAEEKTPTAGSLLAQAQAQSTRAMSTQAPIRRHTLPHELTGGSPPAPAFLGSTPSPSTAAGPSSSQLPGAINPITPSSGSIRLVPQFPSIEEAIGTNSTSPEGVAAREVWRWFVDHLDALLDSIRSWRCDQFEMHLRQFWGSLSGSHREVVHAPAVAGLMAKADAILYDEILEVLRSQMLSPIPTATLTAVRQLADKMEKILLVSLEHYGNTFVEPKVELGARFGHLVLRFMDIYQVTQALNTVLTNPKQLVEMRRSWAKIDFESVRNQSALVCNCRHEDLVQLLEVEFLSILEGLGKSVEPVRDVMSWADKCCERLMRVRGNQTGGIGYGGGEERGMSSRSVLIRWGYVTSQIMRDLTIRSDPAFGAFQILKLFLDDWIALNVLRSVALSTNSVAASVEPVMQQQFFSLSPMAGQESFGPTGHVLAHTPTTSSMLAALQQDTFHTGAGLDHTSASQFGGDAYSGMGGFIDNMDTAGSTGVVVDDGAAAGLFGDYSSSGFDAFGSSELSAITVATPEVGATEESGVKVEPVP